MDLLKPNPQQLAWADCEVGVIIHFDLQVFDPGGGAPSPPPLRPPAAPPAPASAS